MTTPIASNEPLGISGLAKSVWHDFLRARRALFVFQVLFKLLEAWLFVPAVAVVLAVALAKAGRVAVSNWDILDFLLSPFGLLYAAVFAAVTVALLLIEQAGIMVLAALGRSPERPPVKQMLRAACRNMLRVGQLGAVKAMLLALTFLPFVLLAILTYFIFLSRHDIYFYLTDRPPVFWLSAGIGGLLLLAALVAGMLLYVRWAFALPILLFEKQSARTALRSSRERVRGAEWRVGSILIGWQLAAGPGEKANFVGRGRPACSARRRGRSGGRKGGWAVGRAWRWVQGSPTPVGGCRALARC